MLLKNQDRRNCGISSLSFSRSSSHVGYDKTENCIFVSFVLLIPPNSISCTSQRTCVGCNITIVFNCWVALCLFAFNKMPVHVHHLMRFSRLETARHSKFPGLVQILR